MSTQPVTSRFPPGDPTLAYEVAKHKVDLQLDQIDGLDNKASITMGFSLTLLSVLLAVAALRPDSQNQSPVLLSLLFAPSLVVTACVMVLGLRAYRVKVYYSSPPIDTVWENISRYQRGEALMWWAAETYKKAVELNSTLLEEKATYTGRAQIGLVIQAVLSILTLLMILYGVSV